MGVRVPSSLPLPDRVSDPSAHAGHELPLESGYSSTLECERRAGAYSLALPNSWCAPRGLMSIKRAILTTTVSALLLSGVCSAQDWGNYGGNTARCGQSSVSGPTTANLAWSDSSFYSIISWHPFIRDGRIFVIRESGFPSSGGAANDEIVCHDLANGTVLWNTALSFGGDTNTEWIAWIGGANGGQVYASRSSQLISDVMEIRHRITGCQR